MDIRRFDVNMAPEVAKYISALSHRAAAGYVKSIYQSVVSLGGCAKESNQAQLPPTCKCHMGNTASVVQINHMMQYVP